MQETIRLIIFLFFIPWISACAGPNPQSDIAQTPQASQPSSREMTAATKSHFTPEFEDDKAILEPTDKPTLDFATQVNQIALKDTPISTSTPPNICSPLGLHKIDRLPEIVSAPYNPPPEGSDARHHGVDFAYYNHNGRASVQGESVNSIMKGTIVGFSENITPYGNMILIETPIISIPSEVVITLKLLESQSIFHLYAHMIDTPDLRVGDTVECAQFLGYAGNSGVPAANPHLHLETRIAKSGTILGSLAYYTTASTGDERAAYHLWRMSGLFKHFDSMLLFAIPTE